jgi:ParB-like chromosome segregation protein Spo0J
VTAMTKAIEFWDPSKLTPYAKNAKIHTDEQIDRLCAAIKKLGFSAPIVVDKNGVIIAGHGRRLAAIKLGLSKVPVIVRDDLSEDEANALRIADNAASSKEYNSDLLREEILSLQGLDFDLDALGMAATELDFLAADHDILDDSAFVQDVTEAVEEQKAQNSEKTEEVDAMLSPLGDAFGFKKVTVAQSRVIRGFMSDVEADTGKAGADALIDFIQKYTEV